MQVQRQKTISPDAIKSTSSRERAIRNSIRSNGAPRKASPSGLHIGSSILNYEFDSILSVNAGFSLGFEEDISFVLHDQLFRSVENYLRLMGKKLEYKMTDSFETDCFYLYNILKKELPDGIDLNFSAKNSNLQIEVYKPISSFPDFILFYYPVGMVKSMDKQLADIFIKFTAFYAGSQRISFPEDNQDFGYYLSEYGEILEEEIESEECDIERADYLRSIIDSYNEGEANYYFGLVRSLEYDADELLVELEELLKSDTNNSELIQIMIDGVNLLRTDCIMDYEYEPNTESDDFDGFVNFERLFCMIWLDDVLCEYATEMFNTDAMELECLGPYQVLTLTPNTAELIMTENSYPEKYANWHSDFYNKLMSYEQTNN